MSDDHKQGWEGQEAMGARLVEEAKRRSPVEAVPLDDRVMIFPVVPDEERPADLHVVNLSGADLPDMGVVIAVGWEVNRRVLEQAESASEEMQQAMLASAFLGVGDVVMVNKFSGMDVAGTNFVLLHRQSVLGKLRNLPVRLRVEQDRWDQRELERQDREEEAARDALALPGAKIHRP